MLKKIKSFVLSASAMFALMAPMLAPAVVSAQTTTEDIQSSLSCGSQFDVNTSGCATTDPGAESKVNDIVKFAINIFSIIVGIVAVVMIIIGGLKYITSGGESANTASAKNTILFAVVGLVVVALAQIIVRFVLSKVSTAGS